MDSIKTKIVNASQSTKHDNVTYSDLDATGTYIRCLYIPMGARVDSVEVRSNTRFAGNSTAITLKAGHPVGVSQSDTSSAVAAADFAEEAAPLRIFPGIEGLKKTPNPSIKASTNRPSTPSKLVLILSSIFL